MRLGRIYQYPKNLLIFAPLFFSGQMLIKSHLEMGEISYRLGPAFFNCFWTFVAFFLLASGTYIFNGWMDIDFNQLHPARKNRPLVIGTWINPCSFFLMLLFFLSGCWIAFLINWNVLFLCALYVAMVIFYSIIFKHIPILDILIWSIGFLLRLWAGSAATGIALSPFLLEMTFLLALFLGFGKRYSEFTYCKLNDLRVRPALVGYSERLFDLILGIILVMLVIRYFTYTVVGFAQQHSGYLSLSSTSVSWVLSFTNFLMIFGMLRYLQLVYIKKKSADPSYLLLKDPLLFLLFLIWVLSYFWILYVL